MTQQFLSPLLDSELSVTFEFEADYPLHRESGPMNIQLDEEVEDAGSVED